jgi:hypothetical protein
MSPAPKSKDTRSTLVDAYIARSAPFAQPILWHLRELVHKAVPGAEETMKWSMPFFMYNEIILGNIAAFKQHCSFGIWGDEITAKMRADGVVSGDGMGSIGKITTRKDLPADKQIIAYLKQAAASIDAGTRTKNYSRPPRAAKPKLAVPSDLTAALKKNKPAQKTFDAFAPSHRREYIEWIVDAKREETRARRIGEAIEWMSEGKRRNWKYENC